MASLVKTYNEEKLFGKIYTPQHIVEKILDDVGFSGSSILGKLIIDPACGDGQFLTEIVKRIIYNSPQADIKENLSAVYGWDIDQQAVKECINNLNFLIKPLNISLVWNISCCNSILNNNSTVKFDFIVGNPPYVRIQHLDTEMRQYLQKQYICCKSGSTDLFIGFFELCYNLLGSNGKCGLITPNSYLFSNTARTLRNLLITNGCIRQITNFGHFQLFNLASTYSAITILSKEQSNDFLFEEAYSQFDFLSARIANDKLRISKPWQLSVTKKVSSTGIRLGDIASISVGITTLCDNAYIFKARWMNDKYMIVKSKLTEDFIIESDILKPIIKASTFKTITTDLDFILFPYEIKGESYEIIKEDKLKSVYPKAYEYLQTIKHILDRRDNGKPNQVGWYAFGRSQGLKVFKGKKLIFPPIAKKPTFIVDDSESIFYSGYCIRYNGDIEALASELNSQKMEDYISVSARDFRGGYKAYNKTVVQEFCLAEKV
jgi:adenine-specific DNA-methyltransferase